ncbi:uncharacterized protein PHALS_04115 [Plasmopara halstedii]|uniref:Uncharacterized protein n=1 Tax=Plasmopara halstedii TaxID=4781 RepID=A0A0P1A963_PLAHL|nr:uncharacterized protein PHALS_04115 [Plasmopara halstedii]CEG36862.1 hypothetical protein PHALS_04115 [Plasmopara halstedii]|eukprot:XP_024573231.1 hypothetical protein PHALS_04115 [Plasmopara halstedii]
MDKLGLQSKVQIPVCKLIHVESFPLDTAEFSVAGNGNIVRNSLTGETRLKDCVSLVKGFVEEECFCRMSLGEEQEIGDKFPV